MSGLDTYITRDREMLDALCWRWYGAATGAMVPAVLAANSGLCLQPPILPAGLLIKIPARARIKTAAPMRLWD